MAAVPCAVCALIPHPHLQFKNTRWLETATKLTAQGLRRGLTTLCCLCVNECLCVGYVCLKLVKVSHQLIHGVRTCVYHAMYQNTHSTSKEDIFVN